MKIVLTIFALIIIAATLCGAIFDQKLQRSPYYARTVALCVVVAILGAGLVVGGIWLRPFF